MNLTQNIQNTNGDLKTTSTHLKKLSNDFLDQNLKILVGREREVLSEILFDALTW